MYDGIVDLIIFVFGFLIYVLICTVVQRPTVFTWSVVIIPIIDDAVVMVMTSHDV